MPDATVLFNSFSLPILEAFFKISFSLSTDFLDWDDHEIYPLYNEECSKEVRAPLIMLYCAVVHNLN